MPLSGFPAPASIGINEAITHRVPDDVPLRDGDIVVVDTAVRLDGFIVDGARGVVAGGSGALGHRLIAGARAVRAAMLAAIAPGRAWSDVAARAHARAASLGLAIVPGLAGHGVGRALHEPPALPLFGSSGVVLVPGMVITLEPVVALPGGQDGPGPKAYEEWTVALTPRGVRILCG